MSDSFQNIVPKSHQQLGKLMEFFNEYSNTPDRKILDRKARENRLHQLWKSVFFKQSSVYCKYCFINFSNNWWMSEHIKNFHNVDLDSNSKKDPYGPIMKNNCCPIGCSFVSSDVTQIKNHLVIFHSEKQLKLWSMNRRYLKY